MIHAVPEGAGRALRDDEWAEPDSVHAERLGLIGQGS
jgi:hypothetical protein